MCLRRTQGEEESPELAENGEVMNGAHGTFGRGRGESASQARKTSSLCRSRNNGDGRMSALFGNLTADPWRS